MSLFPPAFVLLSFLEDSFPEQRLSFSFLRVYTLVQLMYSSFTLIRAYFPHRDDRKNSICSGLSIPFLPCSARQLKTLTNPRIIILLVFTQWSQIFIFTAVKMRPHVIPSPNWVPSRKVFL